MTDRRTHYYLVTAAAWIGSIVAHPLLHSAIGPYASVIGLIPFIVTALCFRNLNATAVEETARRRHLESMIAHQNRRLSVVRDIGNSVSLNGSVTETALVGLQTLHRYFPEYRATYVTLDADGRMTLHGSIRPAGQRGDKPEPSQVVLKPEQLSRLGIANIYQVSDIERDVEWSDVARTISFVGTRAVLGAPTRIENGVGVLSFSTDVVHEWTDDENATIRAAADILAHAVENVERRRRLQESEERFRTLLDHHLDGLAVTANGKVLYANPALSKMFGFDLGDEVGADPVSFLSPKERERARRRMLEITGDGGTANEYEGTHRDGRTFPIEVSSRRIMYDGTPALLSTIRDITVRRQTETTQRESEARLQVVLDHHFDGVAVVADSSYLYINPTLAKMFGYEQTGLLDCAPLELLQPADRQRASARMKDLTTGASTVHPGEYEGLRKDGSTFPIEILTRPINYGGRQALLGVFRDLTNRRVAEEAIRGAEAKYRNLVENSLAGVYIIQNRRFVYANPRLADIMGYTQDEMLALPSMVELVVDEDKTIVEEKVRQRLAGETETVQYEIRCVRKDGQIIHTEIHGGATSYIGKAAIIGTVLDVTQRREAEEKLRDREQRFRSLFEVAPIGIVVTTPDMRIQQVNPTFREMLGYSEDELVGRSLVDITHPDDVAGTPESAAKVFADSRATIRVNIRYLRKDGSAVQAETTVSVVTDERGNPVYGVAMVEDVTEKVLLEEQIQQIMRLESVGQLAGGVAHNFNNALTAISGYSELLARRFKAEDPALRDLEQIQRVAEQSADLTRQLLAFSRKEHVHPSVFSVNEAVESTRDLLSPLLDVAMRIRLRLDRNIPDVRSDRPQLEQVITNLVLNARDAMPDGGLIAIETRSVELGDDRARTNPEAKPGRYVCVTVSDAGVGMDADTMARIFEPFFTTKEPGQGVGLGLAMVHGAVKQSGGFITVDSVPTKGATFTIYLPQLSERDDESDLRVDADTIH